MSLRNVGSTVHSLPKKFVVERLVRQTDGMGKVEFCGIISGTLCREIVVFCTLMCYFLRKGGLLAINFCIIIFFCLVGKLLSISNVDFGR